MARSRDIHQDWGDYDELHTAMLEGRARDCLTITAMEMTPDSVISCEACGMTFNSIQELGYHEGRRGQHGERTAPMACGPGTG